MTTITIERSLLKQALAVLSNAADQRNIGNPEVGVAAFELLGQIRAHLTQPQGEPVAATGEDLEIYKSISDNYFKSLHPAQMREKVESATNAAPEPVAWLARYVGRSGMEQEYVSTDKNLADENDASGKAQPLYLHPPATSPDELDQLRKDVERKPMTDEEVIDLVRECGLDWHKGFMPLFDDDPTNRFAVLVRAVEERYSKGTP